MAPAAVPEILPGFKRIPIQFIATLADPGANSRIDAKTRRIWVEDPGMPGVWLSLYPVLKAADGYMPGNGLFDENAGRRNAGNSRLPKTRLCGAYCYWC